MGQASVPFLPGWATFYEITGSAAGALTGLQFVVIVLVAQLRSTGTMREIRAFGTPTVVHFCAALLLSATMSAPWHSQRSLALCVGLFGTAGVAYSLRVLSHAQKADYNPDAEDWFWYTAVPITAYLALIAAAVLVGLDFPVCSAMIAVITLLFLITGIHNSWDTVTYIAVRNRDNTPAESAKQKESE